MADDLTPTDYAYLILLQIEGREISNTELDDKYGLRLKGDNYARLNGLGLVSSQKRRSYYHELTPLGAKALDQLLTEKRAKREPIIVALAALYGGKAPASAAVAGDLAERIRAAYAELTTEPGAWVSLARLRPALPDVPKAALDKALVLLLADRDVVLEPEPNQKTLKVEDRRAAVRVGGEDRHLLAIGM